MDLPSDQRAFHLEKKRIALDDKRHAFYVIRIGREDDRSHLKCESQLKLNRFPPQINSLRLQQQKFCRDTELAIAHVHIDLFVGAAVDSLPETAPSKSLAPQMKLEKATLNNRCIPSWRAFTAMNWIQ
jgi:hypothetical protein